MRLRLIPCPDCSIALLDRPRSWMVQLSPKGNRSSAGGCEFRENMDHCSWTSISTVSAISGLNTQSRKHKAHLARPPLGFAVSKETQRCQPAFLKARVARRREVALPARRAKDSGVSRMPTYSESPEFERNAAGMPRPKPQQRELEKCGLAASDSDSSIPSSWCRRRGALPRRPRPLFHRPSRTHRSRSLPLRGRQGL